MAYARRALFAKHPTIPPNLCIFVNSWWSKQLAPMCDENQMPSMWTISISHVGAKCGIHKNNFVVTKLEHALKLRRCLDPYGEWDLNPIHFTCILQIKNIIKTSTNPWLNRKCQVFVQVPNALLMFPIQVRDILEF